MFGFEKEYVMYGSSYYGGGDIFSLLYFAGSAWAALSFVAFVAAVVCTVLLYRKYVSSSPQVAKRNGKHDFGPFFRFERFWSEKILIVLFIYNMCSIAFECAATAVALLFALPYDAGSVFVAILFVVLLFVVSEVLNRLFFEFFMLIVKMWRNTQEIRVSVCGTAPAPSHQQEATAPFASYGTQGKGSSVEAPNPPKQTDDTSSMKTESFSHVSDAGHGEGSWICSACGARNNSGVFCAQCGKHRG